MSKGSSSKTVLIVDDDPEDLEYVEDFLKSKGLEVCYATSLPEALDALSTGDFRLVLVDMNIPARGAISEHIAKSTPLAVKYPGIAVAKHARNIGYGAHSVIAHTVHDDDAADKELERISCRYVLKGRPTVLKNVILNSLSRS